ncbi:MAG: hypothetical protein H0U28_02755 [Nocardioidaceae bacterium]|nr:hypothetical protein [Nocardioidaceae bacterium]
MCDIQYDGNWVYIDWEVNGFGSGRLEMHEGFDECRWKDPGNLPNDKTVEFRVCEEQNLEPDACSYWWYHRVQH